MVKETSSKGKGCARAVLIFFGLFAAAVILIFLFGKEVPITDEDVIKAFEGPPEISEIAEKTTLSTKGKATFYKAEPEFVDSESFRENCLTKEGIEMALGCARLGRKSKIYLLKIDDPNFIDHKYPAAVHEMLHVAYHKLSEDEKNNLKPLLDKELSQRPDDSRLAVNMETLRKAEGDVYDELHSVFGVEYSDLSQELEDYYSQYFADRFQVIQLYQNGGLESRVRRMEELIYQGKNLNVQINQLSNQLEGYKAAGDIDAYNSRVSQYNSMIAQYNSIVAESKKIYGEVDQFYKYFNPSYTPPSER